MMKIAEIYPEKLLLPGVAECTTSMLRRSIADHGILVPIVLCQGLVIDGHRRLLCAKETGIEMAPTIQVEGVPETLYIELNRHRAFSNAEIIGLIRRVKKYPEKKLNIISLLNLKSSPQLIRVLDFLAESNELTDSQINALPINVWRELGHLHTELLAVALWLINLSATTAEKRLIAGLLRQADRRKALPKEFNVKNGSAAISWLNEIVQPRRSKVMSKMALFFEKGRIPPGISIQFDQTFEQPGVQVMINASRNHLDRFDQAKQLVQDIFTQVEEL